jgi:ubiquinone/menaquinone biosynthesis C-methylase UbiE
MVLDRQRRVALLQTFNDEIYWDDYVKNWHKSDMSKKTEYLGCEWTGQIPLLELIRKYSSRDMVALEVGCGVGRITSEAVKLFEHVYVADISKEMLRGCQVAVGLKNVTLQKTDGFTLKELSDASVDLVLSHDVFVHFSSEQVFPYLVEIRRVLKSGGIGILSFHDFVKSFEGFKRSSLDYWSKRRFPPQMGEHFITEEMVRLMLGDLGFEIVEVDTRSFLIVVFRKSSSLPPSNSSSTTDDTLE